MWKVTWAHPEFGQVLASCSFDRTAAVWEEQGIINEHDLLYCGTPNHCCNSIFCIIIHKTDTGEHNTSTLITIQYYYH